LAGLHHQDRWPDQAQALIAGETVAKAAECCKVAYTTAFRWRHRFLSALNLDKPQCLSGIVEGDVGGGLGVPGAGKTWTLTRRAVRMR